MRASLVAGAGLVAAVSASYNGTTPVYTTEVVTAYTTYCPEPTSIVHNNMTYTITEATTFTITDCPCTVTAPVIVSTVTDCTTCPESSTVITSAESTPGLVTPDGPAVVPDEPAVMSDSSPVSANDTVPTGSPQPTTVEGGPGANGTTPVVPLATGAANKAFVASGAALAGLVGLVGYVL